MELIRAVDKEFVLQNWPTNASASPIVIEAVLHVATSRNKTSYFLVCRSVQIAVSVVPPPCAVPIVGAGFGDDVKLAARRVAVFCAELIREQREFRDRLLNNRLCRAIHIQAVVIHTVNGEPVESTDGTAHRRLAYGGGWWCLRYGHGRCPRIRGRGRISRQSCWADFKILHAQRKRRANGRA